MAASSTNDPNDTSGSLLESSQQQGDDPGGGRPWKVSLAFSSKHGFSLYFQYSLCSSFCSAFLAVFPSCHLLEGIGRICIVCDQHDIALAISLFREAEETFVF